MLVTKAFSYSRFSSPEQRKGDSLRRQVEASRKFAQAHGLELDEGLSDIGISAYRGANRYKGALARFLQLVREGKVPKGSFLLVESLDRLSREQVLEPIPEVWIHAERIGRVKRRSMVRIMARRMKAATVRA